LLEDELCPDETNEPMTFPDLMLGVGGVVFVVALGLVAAASWSMFGGPRGPGDDDKPTS